MSKQNDGGGRPAEDLDPEYKDLLTEQNNQQRLLESGAQEATVKKIVNIVREQFAHEVQYKESEIALIDQRLHQARHMLDRLRACIIASYYSRAGQPLAQVKKTGAFQPCIHPAVKPHLGKAPVQTMKSEPVAPQSQDENNEQLEFRVRNSGQNNPAIKEEPLSNDTSNNASKEMPTMSETEQESWNGEGRASRFKVKKTIVVGNISKFIPSSEKETSDQTTHKWMVYVRGSREEPSLESFVQKVWFFLHPSYRPNDLVQVSQPPFHLSRRGWGEFPVRVQIHFKDPRNKKIDIIHNLKLDRTYTGLQTLGAETVVSVEIEKEGTENLPDKFEVPLPMPSTPATVPKPEPKFESPLSLSELGQACRKLDMEESPNEPPVKKKRQTPKTPRPKKKKTETSDPGGGGDGTAPELGLASSTPTKEFGLKSDESEKAPNGAQGTPKSPKSAKRKKSSEAGLLAPTDQGGTVVVEHFEEPEEKVPAFIANLAEYGLKPGDPPLVPIVTVGTEEVSSLPPKPKQRRRKSSTVTSASTVTSSQDVPGETAKLAAFGLKPGDPPLVPIVTVGTEEVCPSPKKDKDKSPRPAKRKRSKDTESGIVEGTEMATPKSPKDVKRHKSAESTDGNDTVSVPKSPCQSSEAEATSGDTVASLALLGSSEEKVKKAAKKKRRTSSSVSAISTDTESTVASIVEAVASGQLDSSAGLGDTKLDVGTVTAEGQSEKMTSDKLASPGTSLALPGTNQGDQPKSETPIVQATATIVGSTPKAGEGKEQAVYLRCVDAQGKVYLIPQKMVTKISQTPHKKQQPQPQQQLASLVELAKKKAEGTSQGETDAQGTTQTGVIQQDVTKQIEVKTYRPIDAEKAAQTAAAAIREPSPLSILTNLPSGTKSTAASPTIANISQISPGGNKMVLTSRGLLPMASVLQEAGVKPPGYAASRPTTPVNRPMSQPATPSNSRPGTPSMTTSSKGGVSVVNQSTVHRIESRPTTSQTATNPVVQVQGGNIIIVPPQQSVGKGPGVKKGSALSLLGGSVSVGGKKAGGPTQSFITTIDGQTLLLQVPSGSVQGQGQPVDARSVLKTQLTKVIPKTKGIGPKGKDMSGTAHYPAKQQVFIPIVKENRGHLYLNVSDYGCLEDLIRAAVKTFPVVEENPDRVVQPYCAPSEEKWLKWNVGKRRASELARASHLRKAIIKLLKNEETFHGEPIWSKFRIVKWCRQHLYTPLDAELKKRFTSGSSKLSRRQLHSYSDCEQLLNELQQGEDDAKKRVTVDDEEVDVEVLAIDVQPQRTPKVKKELLSPEKETPQGVKQEAPDAPGVIRDSIPASLPTVFVMNTAKQVGADLKYTAIDELYMPITAEMVLVAMKKFVDTVVRESVSCAMQHNRLPEELSVVDVHKGILKVKRCDFLRNSYLGCKKDDSAGSYPTGVMATGKGGNSLENSGSSASFRTDSFPMETNIKTEPMETDSIATMDPEASNQGLSSTMGSVASSLNLKMDVLDESSNEARSFSRSQSFGTRAQSDRTRSISRTSSLASMTDFESLVPEFDMPPLMQDD